MPAKTGSRVAILAAVTTIAVTWPVMAAERMFDVRDFDMVSIGDGLSSEILVGPDFEVSAQALSTRMLNKLDVIVKGRTLHIRRDKSWMDMCLRWMDLCLFAARRAATIRISMPDLVWIGASDGADVNVSGDLDDDFEALASIGADLELRDISAVQVQLMSSSGADLRARGECKELRVSVYSGAELSAQDLVCQEVSANAFSGSDLWAHATHSLTANASSGGNIRVSGKPVSIQKSVSSGGDVKFD